MTLELFSFCYSDAAMDTDEGEKEVPAKKPKTDPVLVRQLQAKYNHAPFFSFNLSVSALSPLCSDEGLHVTLEMSTFQNSYSRQLHVSLSLPRSES